jgi:hypothetical protein
VRVVERAPEALHEEREVMSEKKYVVPEGGLDAVRKVAENNGGVSAWTERGLTCYPAVVEAFIRWQSENPVVPTLPQLRSLLAHLETVTNETTVQNLVVDWQRRMYLDPADRFTLAVSQIQGKRLTYAELTGKGGETEAF